MTFVEMYGEGLDHELGSSDRTERFTTARRKLAILNAQRDFARDTDCFQREAQIDLQDGISEYDLEVVINDEAFLRFVDQQPWLQLTDSNGVVRTVTGPEFPRVDIPLMDREQPGWRSQTGTAPISWYLREDGGRSFIGVTPEPSITAGSTWLLFVPYSAYPADMSLDTDEPFATTAGGNTKIVLRAYHQALVHKAASQLEKLRRNYPQMKDQLMLYGSFVEDWKSRRQPTGGTRVSLARGYFADAQRRRPQTPPYGR